MHKLFSSAAGKMTAILTAAAILIIALLNTVPLFFFRRAASTTVESDLKSLQQEIEHLFPEAFDTFCHAEPHPAFRFMGVDASGLVRYDSDSEQNKTGSLLLTESFSAALGGRSVFFVSRAQHAFFFSLTFPMQSTDSSPYAVGVLIHADPALSEKYAAMQQTLAYFSVCLALLFAAAIVFIYRRISSSTRALLSAMGEIQKGNFSYRITSGGDSEFVHLGDGMNAICETFAATDERRRRFVSDASHELKTPLAGIKLLSDSIIQTPNMSREEIVEFLTDISNEIDRLTRISSRLLSLAKFDDISRSELKEELDLSSVAATVCRMLTPLARASNCTIRYELSDKVMVYANYDSVYQIFFNLVENSIKYSGKDKEVRVFLYVRDNQAHFIVDDDGEGIPQDDLKRIFDRFYRVDKARARATGGTGLGLSIVATAVKACGGTVEAMNRDSGGARFIVKFPLLDPNEHHDFLDDVPLNGGDPA